MPILLFDRAYWESMINFDRMVEMGFIEREDMKLFHFFDSPGEGVKYLKGRLEKGISSINHRFHA